MQTLRRYLPARRRYFVSIVGECRVCPTKPYDTLASLLSVAAHGELQFLFVVEFCRTKTPNLLNDILR